MPSPNEELLRKLFANISCKKPVEQTIKAIEDCYADDATFKDIAFDLHGNRQIMAMWEMILLPDAKGKSTEIEVVVNAVTADEEIGVAEIVDTYVFRKTGHKVVNEITSTFRFKRGKIVSQNDHCDPKVWASKAFGPLMGFIPGRIESIRRRSAMRGLPKTLRVAFSN